MLREENQLFGLAAAFVLAAAVSLMLAAPARAGTWAVGADLSLLGFAGVWLACAAIGVFVVQRALPDHDPYLLPIVYLLSGWGIALIWRLTSDFAMRQTIWLVVGTAVMLVIVLMPGDLRWLRRFRYTWLVAGLALTALTLILGVNPSGAGEHLWLGCCGLYLQPAELLKLLLVVFLASYLTDRGDLLFQTRPGISIPLPRRQTLVYFLPMLVMWGFSTLILVSQRDLGMSTLFFGVFIVMLYLASGRWEYVAAGVVLVAVGALLGYFLFDVVRLRVQAWWNPWADPSGRSFQIVQSLIAVAAGGVFGAGPGQGAPTLIPVAQSDFIFAALAEEWGLLGVVAMTLLEGAVVLRALRIAAGAPSAFGQLLAGGLGALLGLQALLIMGGVVKLLPLTGVTVPFVSYGGSSLVASFCAVGVLLRLSVMNNARVHPAGR
jgi:cell division protein FtsW (lipid II flippase)